MFRSYDHLQEENILLVRITQLTTDPLLLEYSQQYSDRFYMLYIYQFLYALVDMVAVMVDVFALVN
jgi:hypothetical protein